MTTPKNTSCQVSVPSNRIINKIKHTVGYLWCKDHLSKEDIIATLNECKMDLNETCRRLTMIKEDPSESARRRLLIEAKTATNGNTVQEVEKKEDTEKTESNSDNAVQEVEKEKDAEKTESNGDIVKEAVEKKKSPVDSGANKKPGNYPYSVRVGNLSEDTTQDDLFHLFRDFGKVRARVVTDYETGRSRGFGFVNFTYRQDAELAIEKLDRSGLDHRILRVGWAAPRSFNATRTTKPSSQVN